MQPNKLVSRQEWQAARRELLQREKAHTREREALAQARRELPWVEVDRTYQFQTERGVEELRDLFGGCSQLIVYHFMFGSDWREGCPSCSFWADTYDGALPHLAARDIRLVAVSRAPLATLHAYRVRMGWGFDWVSTVGSDFNREFAVSFPGGGEEPAQPNYNFATQVFKGEEAPGLSVFYRDGSTVYHTYSCYARGLDMLNSTYQHIDLVPRGRDEQGLPWPMAWVRRHDEYGQ